VIKKIHRLTAVIFVTSVELTVPAGLSDWPVLCVVKNAELLLNCQAVEIRLEEKRLSVEQSLQVGHSLLNENSIKPCRGLPLCLPVCLPLSVCVCVFLSICLQPDYEQTVVIVWLWNVNVLDLNISWCCVRMWKLYWACKLHCRLWHISYFECCWILWWRVAAKLNLHLWCCVTMGLSLPK